MQPIYELDNSVREDVAKLRKDHRIKPTTGGGLGGAGVQGPMGT